MAEYIEREAFVESQHNIYCINCDRRKDSKGKFVYFVGDAPCRSCGIMDVLDAVEEAPAADVRPVVRGKWAKELHPNVRYNQYKCSICGEFSGHDSDGWIWTPNFCPNCGARMEES
jgi:predicted RNA-binding Zn-ribbon protein involved in translation (DUF1610 family)